MRNKSKIAGRDHSVNGRKQLPPSFKSDFALLDVKKGRGALVKRIKAGEKILLRIDIEIFNIWGSDDGISQEFCCEVKGMKQL